MYILFQNVNEFKVKDLLFTRYNNVNQLLETFSDMREVKEFFKYFLEQNMEEDIYRFYLHKSVMSDVSYQDFRNSVLEQQATNTMISEEEQEKILEEAMKVVKVKEV